MIKKSFDVIVETSFATLFKSFSWLVNMSSARGSHVKDIENEKFRSSWYHIGSDRSIIANLNVVRIFDDGKNWRIANDTIILNYIRFDPDAKSVIQMHKAIRIREFLGMHGSDMMYPRRSRTIQRWYGRVKSRSEYQDYAYFKIDFITKDWQSLIVFRRGETLVSLVVLDDDRNSDLRYSWKKACSTWISLKS